MPLSFTGIADEAGNALATQLEATKSLGWSSIEMRNVEIPGFANANLHEIPEAAFETLVETIETNEITISAFGSTIANWAHSIDDYFSITEEKVARAIPRMQRLGTKFIRIMSYAIRKNPDGTDAEDQREQERFIRLLEIKKRFDDAGLTVVHENCMNYGGMGISHALKLLENVPGLRWVYDTGNPVFNNDRDAATPGAKQDSWQFYQAVKPHISHIHIKDGIWNPSKNDCDYTMPGQGDGQVERILTDLIASGYDGYISIEPHVSVVFHSVGAADDRDPVEKAREQFDSYVNYGRNLEQMVDRIKTNLSIQPTL